MASSIGFVPGAELDAATAELFQAVQSLRQNAADSPMDPKYRAKAIEAAQAVVDALKHPSEDIVERYFGLAALMATRLFATFNGFDAIPVEGSISYSDLAEELNSEESLIRRIAWVLVSNGILKQIDGDQVMHTPKSQAFVGPDSLQPALQLIFSQNLPAFLALPDYFRKYGRKEPATRTHTPISFAFGRPELTVWELMRQDPDPEKVAKGMQAMAAFEKTMPMTGVYDFSWVALEASASPNRVLLVDVGASKGHVTKAICQSTPGIPMGRCVLQDLPEVIEELEEVDDPELRDAQKFAIDFHQEQPVKGALVYFIRRCLHDYGDEECVQILRVLAEAMAPDSRLIILEQVMTNPPVAMAAGADFLMMNLGGKERTASQFAALASRSGLRINETYLTEGFGLSAIECVRV